jgi:hypothetical protein
MYPLQKIKGNKTSVFIIIFMSIMIISTTAIILSTANPVYGQPDKTSFNLTDSSNLQSIPTNESSRGGY